MKCADNGIINFCNPKKTYQVYSDELLTEIKKILSEGDFCNGSAVRAFEKDFGDYLRIENVCGLSNGTDSVFLALKALGITSGDEVIVPANTFVGSVWGIVYCGAKPVFCDCTHDTWEIDPLSVSQKITDKTKAVIGVHLYGHPFDYEGIKKAALPFDLKIIEDCAQAHGALYKNQAVGTLADIGCFSFYPTKNLGAIGDAGCAVTNRAELAERINRLRVHSPERGTYDHTETGYNMRMDSLQAAALRISLRHLEEWNARRREIARIYREEIRNPAFTFQTVSSSCLPVWHLFVVKVPERKHFLEYMKSKNIICGVHYGAPCHRLTAFKELTDPSCVLPECEDLAEHCVSLPMSQWLTPEEIERVIDACNCYKYSAEKL